MACVSFLLTVIALSLTSGRSEGRWAPLSVLRNLPALTATYKEQICAPVTHDHAHFSYDINSDHGPDHWHNLSSCCGGSRQSPIALNRTEAFCGTVPTPFYTEAANLTGQLYNSGHDVHLTLSHQDYDARLNRVGTNSMYQDYALDNVHVHFGNRTSLHQGCEHEVDGRLYDAEIHLVHFDDKWETVAGSMVHQDGLVVVAIMMSTEEGETNAHLDELLNAISLLKGIGPGNASQFTLCPSMLLPTKRELFFYHGSLTTPSCSETVQFLVMKDPLRISPQQLQKLWGLPSDVPGKSISDFTNLRPLQNTNNRPVYTNFKC